MRSRSWRQRQRRHRFATLIGTVRGDSVGNELSGADVKLSGLAQHVLTDARGIFRINSLPAGRYSLTIRHLGFRTRHDTIDVEPGRRIERELVMVAQPPELDSVRVVAQGKKWLYSKLSGPPIRPDFGRLTARDYAAVEFYAGGATIPAQYNMTGSDCGVLLLWTRER